MDTLLLKKLKNMPELDADAHDGCYELVRAVIDAYRDVDEAVIDYKDLNTVYLMTVGTWRHGTPAKKRVINDSHLSEDSKVKLTGLLDKIKEKAAAGGYDKKEPGYEGTIGIFGTGIYSFQGKTNNESASAFVKMCVDISDKNDDDEMYDRAEQVLNKDFRGMGAGSASMVLHCLKPETFPILNFGTGDIFSALGIKLIRKNDIDTYIQNCRAIKAFRDANLPFKNYRIIDMLAWSFDNITISIQEIIKRYKEDFANRDKEERYKWEAVKCFQDNWNIEAEDFRGMLEASLSKSGNLLTSRNIYAKDRIIFFAEKEPETVRSMFADLFDEDKDLISRINSFISVSDALFNKHKNDVIKRHCQDARNICVYLFFRYPEKYYLYQYGKYKAFAEKVGYETKIVQGDNKNVIGYLDMCNMVLEEMMKDEELLSMSRERFDDKCYADPEYHLLTDDIVYFGGLVDPQYWPSLSEYNPGIDEEKWIELIGNKDVFDEPALLIMKRMLEIGGEATCSLLSARYGENPNFYNTCSIRLAKRVHEATNCPLLVNEKNARWWPILYVGRRAGKEETGEYVWKLRPELKSALEKTIPGMVVNPMKREFSKNMILYGPPGTGKTYHTVNYAVAIIENKFLDEVLAEDYSAVKDRFNQYKEDGLIEFTTFHQSYGYEEFIEGIKPVFSTDGEETTDISYEIADGVFKKICDRASMPVISKSNDFGFSEYSTVWKVSLAGTGDNPVRRDCMKNNYIRIGWDEYSETITDETDFSKAGGKNALNAFINRMQIGDIVLSCYSERTIDAVGVIEGDYEWRPELKDYCRVRKVKWIVKGINYDIYELNNNNVMTLSTVYRLNNISVSDVIEILKQTSSQIVSSDAPKNYVFIIDEINRGNISKIFGELLTLIEPSKRVGQREELKVRLPYSQRLFGVPDNVYIIGTMNTADRSIALIDTALRRRFNFVEMQPDIEILEGIEIDNVSIAGMLSKINRRIEVLYDREHTIGHAYFLPLKDNPTLEQLGCIFEQKIVPLLQEYFFDDYEKIRLVLGDENKDTPYQFIIKKPVDHSDLFGKVDLEYDETAIYEINKAAFFNINSYKGI